MANPKHLAVLRQGVERWNAWINSQPDSFKADLRGVDVHAVDLRYTNLRKANLRKANLNWADLSFASVSEANLSAVDLRHATLYEADVISQGKAAGTRSSQIRRTVRRLPYRNTARSTTGSP